MPNTNFLQRGALITCKRCLSHGILSVVCPFVCPSHTAYSVCLNYARPDRVWSLPIERETLVSVTYKWHCGIQVFIWDRPKSLGRGKSAIFGLKVG